MRALKSTEQTQLQFAGQTASFFFGSGDKQAITLTQNEFLVFETSHKMAKEWRSLSPMEKQINCTACGRSLKVNGPVQGTKEVMHPVTCPACKTPNEVSWPISSGVYTVTLP